ncbi:MULTISPECIES: hypothetical protein [unclassified Peribacillus]
MVKKSFTNVQNVRIQKKLEHINMKKLMTNIIEKLIDALIPKGLGKLAV